MTYRQRLSKAKGHQLALLLGALIACVSSNPGQVPADTKLYLYTNPLRLISDSIWSWDGRNFGGWVPHQNVGYLWPTGPFFALFDALSVPDWFTHRLWLTVLLGIAGVGSYRLARFLGLSGSAAFLAGAMYQFSPYVLPYISRTSALLIPWSLLPWLIIISLKYAHELRRRDLALFAVLIASSGGLNATALMMIAPAPLIWMIHEYRSRIISFRRLVTASVRLGFVSLLVSMWWLAGLFIQGRFGADVLAYSEALVSTSATSSAPEVLRGLGYWLFYDRGPVAPLTSASWPYQSSVALIAIGAILIVVALVGLLRFASWKAPAATMLLVGVVLAVGAHPFTDSSLLFRLLSDNPTSSLSLALRSSTRAAPLVVLALALGLGAFWNSRRRNHNSFRAKVSYALLIVLIVGNLPAAVNGDIVDRVLTRPEELPQAWTDAAAYLDERFDEGHTGAVLLVPGIESAAYRWGYPVDAILPGLTRKPLLTRDWLPLGSPPLMDLLYALDDSFQNGTAEPTSIAPIARLLGADTVMFVSSHQYERFGTIKPSRASDYFDPTPPGLTHLADFGQPIINVAPTPSDAPPMWSEEIAAYPPVELPEITLFAVDQEVSPARLFREFELVAGDGTGLVELAAASVVSGRDLIISEGSLEDDHLISLASQASRILITDSNRRRAHHWRGSQDVWGATEPEVGVLTVRDDFDSRLPIDSGRSTDSFSIVEEAPVEALATGYGPALRFHPEYRPRMAIDGDPSTAWRVGSDRPALGQVLTLQANGPIDTLSLLQVSDSASTMWITDISIRVDSGQWIEQQLEESSRVTPGQEIVLEESGRLVDIRIDGTTSDQIRNSPGVGFAEVLDSSLVSPEIIRLPERLRTSDESPIAYSLSRLRSDPLDRQRLDPEQSMMRRLTQVMRGVSEFDATIRLSSRAHDDILAAALGIDSGLSVERLHGGVHWWGPSAFDGDPATSWRPSVSITDTGDWGSLKGNLDEPIEWIEFEQPMDSQSSRITRVRISFFKDGVPVESIVVDLPDSDFSPVSRISVPNIDADSIELTVVGIESFDVTDEITGRTISAPIALAELRSNSWSNTELPESFDTGCRSDLIFIDESPVPIRLAGSTAAALRGEQVQVTLCGVLPDIKKGSVLETAPGRKTGWDIDHIFLSSSASSIVPAGPANIELDVHRAHVSARIPGCSRACWIEMPFGFSDGWRADFSGSSLGPPLRSAAGRSLWSLENVSPGVFSAQWVPQTWMWVGLAVSLSTLVLLIALALRDRKHPRTQALEGDPLLERVRIPSRLLAALSGFALGTVLVTPIWGVFIGVSVIVFPRKLLGRLAIGAVVVGFAYVALQQIRTGAQPGFSWPSVFERAHRPMLATLIVYVISVHLTGLRQLPPTQGN